jgi:hypothetical protein
MSQDEFRCRGWYGRGPLQVSLRGPIQNGTLVHGDLLSKLGEIRPVACFTNTLHPNLGRSGETATQRQDISTVDPDAR